MSDSQRDSEGWPDHRLLVLHELKRLGEVIEEMDRQNRADHARVMGEISNVKTEIGALKVKSSFYGGLAGLGAGIAIFLAQLFGRSFGH